MVGVNSVEEAYADVEGHPTHEPEAHARRGRRTFDIMPFLIDNRVL